MQGFRLAQLSACRSGSPDDPGLSSYPTVDVGPVKAIPVSIVYCRTSVQQTNRAWVLSSYQKKKKTELINNQAMIKNP